MANEPLPRERVGDINAELDETVDTSDVNAAERLWRESNPGVLERLLEAEREEIEE